MTSKNNNQTLPPKTCTIERLITKPKDIEKVINGKKTATRRNGRYADVGEIMELNNHKYRVEQVYTQKLGEVTEDDAKQEGYDNLDEYKQAILSLHPGMKWVPKMEVWVHEFAPFEK
ncbi:ASCH domain-containing protein [Virgibacillus alimentarius]|uniref:ASCH domain-containing protein n=1 Tax=Virgibacillus alimentarius TaxID=698769 RepID=A0ABS4S9Y5_9BACI|nr:MULTISPECIES: ASCH domain-containing protein [Virgibacillus]MBP2258325.1 hypothetical protein [Virgibacillus alimentarius]HLR67979.1 ASCH domain-containing protein [Virgibacillus sp.]